MNPFVSFIASPAGRMIRILAGIGLFALGILGLGGTDGYIVSAVGAVPLLTGIFDICLLSPLLGCPVSGSKVRAKNRQVGSVD